MRELKFRAWDKLNKRMLNNQKLLQAMNVNHMMEVTNSEQFVEMQFVNLRDKNGREIYEGDILEFQNEEAAYIPTEVIWEEQFELLDDEWFDGEKYTNVKVIGNIFENPELLEEKND